MAESYTIGEIDAIYRESFGGRVFKGKYEGLFEFKETSGRIRKVINCWGDPGFKYSADAMTSEISHLERQEGISIWKGILDYRIYVDNRSEVGRAALVKGEFVRFRMTGVNIVPGIHWNILCSVFLEMV